MNTQEAANTNVKTNSIKQFLRSSGSGMTAATAFSMAMQPKNTRPDKTYLSSSVRYEIVGKLCDTTNLKATAVNRRVRVTLSRSEGEVISTENEQNDRISMRNIIMAIFQR